MCGGPLSSLEPVQSRSGDDPSWYCRTPTVVLLAKGVAGLLQDSVALCHQITTLDRSKLEQQIGYFAEPELRANELAVLNAIDIHSE